SPAVRWSFSGKKKGALFGLFIVLCNGAADLLTGNQPIGKKPSLAVPADWSGYCRTLNGKR
ncbi:MAG TPA: hypothetical protein PK875_04405, partial [Spirochaetota bacterium]|nr:hypothetical protein [Spirochaetota bacterium]